MPVLKHAERYHDTGTKRLQHPAVGRLELAFEVMTLMADAGLTRFVFTAERGSRSDEALSLLASWTAALVEAEPSSVTDR